MSSNLTIATSAKKSLPWHGWLLGGIFLLYSLAATFDSLMTFIHGETYFRANGMNEMQIAYFSNLPVWVRAGMEICIWGGLLASILLLLKKSISAKIFAIAAISNLTYIIYAYFLSDGITAMGILWSMPIIITLLMIGMVFYCRGVTKVSNVNFNR